MATYVVHTQVATLSRILITDEADGGVLEVEWSRHSHDPWAEHMSALCDARGFFICDASSTKIEVRVPIHS